MNESGRKSSPGPWHEAWTAGPGAEALRQETPVWFIAQKPDLTLLDVR
jgi:hypothetical protein